MFAWFVVSYRINTSKVIHQVFDGEVVIVNLETGIYYSVRGSGIDLWQAIEAGVSPELITKQLNGAAAPEKISDFLTQLEREQLILPVTERSTANESTLQLKSFSEPVVEKFTDMREMLLIDPIHELDEGGWPKRSTPREER
jgi:hypothetical protein